MSSLQSLQSLQDLCSLVKLGLRTILAYEMNLPMDLLFIVSDYVVDTRSSWVLIFMLKNGQHWESVEVHSELRESSSTGWTVEELTQILFNLFQQQESNFFLHTDAREDFWISMFPDLALYKHGCLMALPMPLLSRHSHRCLILIMSHCIYIARFLTSHHLLQL